MSAIAESYACASGGVIVAGRHLGSASLTATGDSLTDPNTGFCPYVGAISRAGGKLKMLANTAIYGNTVQMMIDRAHNSYLTAYPHPGFAGLPELAGKPKVDFCLVLGGANDYRGGGDYPYAKMLTLLGICAQYARWVGIVSPTPVTNTAGNAASILGGEQLKDYAEANPDVFFYIDAAAGMRNPDGTVKDGMLVDDVHFASLARPILETAIGAALLPRLSGFGSPIITDPADVYPATNQWFRNPTNIYSGPPKTGGIAGPLANNMSFNAPGIAGTCELVAADAGDQNQIPWQRLSLTQATAANSTYIGLGTSGRTITSIDPSLIDVVAEVRCVGFDSTIFPSISTFIQGAGTGEFFVPEDRINFVREMAHTQNYVLRNTRRRAGATVPSGLNLYLKISCSQIFGPQDTGSIDFRCVTARG